MTGAVTPRSRLRTIAVLSLILILLGTGASAAYWTATAQVDGVADAATVGLDQSADTSSLSTIYSAKNPSATGAVEITNTGSRKAGYTFEVRGDSTTDEALPAALAVTAVPVDRTLDCLPSTEAEHGSALPYALEGTIGAGETLVLCVTTSLAEQEATEFGGQELMLSIVSILNYAEGGDWTVPAQAQNATQSVEGAPIDAEAGPEIFCSDQEATPDYLGLAFPGNPGYEHKTSYRMFLAREETPNQRAAYEPERETNEHNMAVSFMQDDPELQAYVDGPNGGWGNTWLFIEQQVEGSDDWTPTAHSKIRFVERPGGAEGVGTQCGWQE